MRRGPDNPNQDSQGSSNPDNRNSRVSLPGDWIAARERLRIVLAVLIALGVAALIAAVALMPR